MFSSRGKRRISWRGAENRAQLKSFKATPVSLELMTMILMYRWLLVLADLSTMLRLRSLVSPSSKSWSSNKWIEVGLHFRLNSFKQFQIILGTTKKNSTWKVFAGIMILEDFPAVRGTWTNFISSGSIVFDLWHMWHTWHMLHVGHIWHVTRPYVLFSVFKDQYMHTFDRLFQW